MIKWTISGVIFRTSQAAYTELEKILRKQSSLDTSFQEFLVLQNLHSCVSIILIETQNMFLNIFFFKYQIH